MRRTSLASALLLSIAAVACGGDDAQDAAEAAADAMRNAADAMQNAADNMASSDDADAPAMTAEEMQESLPEEMAGLTRTTTERQSMGAGGMNISQAEATYEGDGKTLEISLMSGAVMAGPAMAFTMVQFDRTTEDGYERTIQYDGMPGMQEYEEDGDYRRAVMTVLVNNSLLVRIEAEGMTMDEVEDVFDDLDVT
ncbi:MAG: hypothetical protein KJP18_03275 [Gemmatimonadetes bacterium]|nr:hypothetical protein [Gemmatimonadota bacterium]NNF38214.1 hypothetical protein [Gemmatimonadota bacterium]